MMAAIDLDPYLSATRSCDCGQVQMVAADPMAIPMETAELVRIPLDKEFKIAAEKVKSDLFKLETKIHRYPAMLRSHMNNDRYFVPSTVAIGPYHHGAPRLQEAEEVKRAAVHHFCEESNISVDKAYEDILSIVDDARSCYPDDVVKDISDADFATMMLHDVCFLQQYLRRNNGNSDSPLQAWFETNEVTILMDIYQLENQIPWLVVKKILGDRSLTEFLGGYVDSDESFTCPHLLGILRYNMSGILDSEEHLPFRSADDSPTENSSAIELGEIGIKLMVSTTKNLKDMGIKKDLLFGKLLLAPFNMNSIRACWLVNMSAHEVCMGRYMDANCTVISSYVAVVAMLMNREEDVYELRARGLVQGKFSDQETLEFFKNLVRHLFPGPRYMHLLAHLDAYKRERWMRIAVHKFIYNHYRAIVTVFSVIGVLVGIFKTLLSLKQH